MAGKGIAIFADYGTTKRKVVFADPNENDLQEVANRDGGNWVLVDELELFDVLEFECTEPYNGFDSSKGEQDTYCGKNLKKQELKGKVNVRRYG